MNNCLPYKYIRYRFARTRVNISTLFRTHIHLVNIKINLYSALVVIPIGAMYTTAEKCRQHTTYARDSLAARISQYPRSLSYTYNVRTSLCFNVWNGFIETIITTVATYPTFSFFTARVSFERFRSTARERYRWMKNFLLLRCSDGGKEYNF